MALSGKIYVFGGYDGNKYLYDGLRYTPSSNTWSFVAPLPYAYAGMSSATTSDGRIAVFGDIVDSTYLYNPSANTWAGGTPKPDGASSAGAQRAANGLIYVFGGCCVGGGSDSYATAENWAYNPTADSWTQAASMTTARDQQASATDSSGRLYAIGRCNVDNCTKRVIKRRALRLGDEYLDDRRPPSRTPIRSNSRTRA